MLSMDLLYQPRRALSMDKHDVSPSSVRHFAFVRTFVFFEAGMSERDIIYIKLNIGGVKGVDMKKECDYNNVINI